MTSSLFLECAELPAGCSKRSRYRGGARRPHREAWPSCTLSVRPRAPTKQMGLFQHPAVNPGPAWRLPGDHPPLVAALRVDREVADGEALFLPAFSTCISETPLTTPALPCTRAVRSRARCRDSAACRRGGSRCARPSTRAARSSARTSGRRRARPSRACPVALPHGLETVVVGAKDIGLGSGRHDTLLGEVTAEEPADPNTAQRHSLSGCAPRNAAAPRRRPWRRPSPLRGLRRRGAARRIADGAVEGGHGPRGEIGRMHSVPASRTPGRWLPPPRAWPRRSHCRMRCTSSGRAMRGSCRSAPRCP